MNRECNFMHLTNYAVNKNNKDYVPSDDIDGQESSKRSLSWLFEWLTSEGHNTNTVWFNICDIVVKTLISIQASLASAYRSTKTDVLNQTPFGCFEVLGFDILLQHDLTPVLLEVNHTPSFRTDSKLDDRIKSALIADTLNGSYVIWYII
jgi:tubulin polyglutamylase TTLL6/13